VEEMEIKDRGILNVIQKILNGEWFFCFLHNLDLELQHKIALWLSRLTKQDSTVLDMSPDDIMEKACVALLFDKKTDKVIASASMMKPQINSFGWKLGEIGSMFTLEEYQNQGCASYLVHKIDEWAEAQPTIDGTYAFLNSKSPRSFAVNGYRGELRKEGVLYNAADITPAYAFNLCRTICRNEHAIHLMDLELRKKELQDPELEEGHGELRRIEEELSSARIERRNRFENSINENKLKINAIAARKDLSTEQIDHDIEVHYKIIDFYIDNFKNNLHCCDVVVAKLF
jgi:Acetyltransferase (GNAT) family.